MPHESHSYTAQLSYHKDTKHKAHYWERMHDADHLPHIGQIYISKELADRIGRADITVTIRRLLESD